MSFLGTLGALRAGIVRDLSLIILVPAMAGSQSESECASPPKRSDIFPINNIGGRKNTQDTV